MQEQALTDQHTYDTRSWAERNGFSDWALALIWIIVAFVFFQVTAGIIAVVLLLFETDGSLDPAAGMDLMYQHLDLVFIGNSAGQILFLGLATLLFVRLHTGKSERASFLRFKVHSNTLAMAGLTVLLILAVQPAVWFLAWLNAQLPVPEILQEMQASQMELIEQFLRGDHVLLLTLFHVGIVPAVCEEILYRGYVLRAFQKSWGIWAAIIVSGLLFGLYHVQLTNLLPLAAIGIVLAIVTWTSESIYPAMLAHFINNGGSVLVGTYYPESAFAELTPESMPPLWAVALSLLVSSYLVYLMIREHKSKTTGEADV